MRTCLKTFVLDYSLYFLKTLYGFVLTPCCTKSGAAFFHCYWAYATGRQREDGAKMSSLDQRDGKWLLHFHVFSWSLVVYDTNATRGRQFKQRIARSFLHFLDKLCLLRHFAILFSALRLRKLTIVCVDCPGDLADLCIVVVSFLVDTGIGQSFKKFFSFFSSDDEVNRVSATSYQ